MVRASTFMDHFSYYVKFHLEVVDRREVLSRIKEVSKDVNQSEEANTRRRSRKQATPYYVIAAHLVEFLEGNLIYRRYAKE